MYNYYLFLECTTSLELHEILRSLSSFVSPVLLLVLVITSSLIFWPFLFSWYMTVLCFALPLRLPLTVCSESFSALSSSLTGLLVLFLLFLHPALRRSEVFLAAALSALYWQFAYLLFLKNIFLTWLPYLRCIFLSASVTDLPR